MHAQSVAVFRSQNKTGIRLTPKNIRTAAAPPLTHNNGIITLVNKETSRRVTFATNMMSHLSSTKPSASIPEDGAATTTTSKLFHEVWNNGEGELSREISSWLPVEDLFSLAQTNMYFRYLLSADDKQGIWKQAEDKILKHGDKRPSSCSVKEEDNAKAYLLLFCKAANFAAQCQYKEIEYDPVERPLEDRWNGDEIFGTCDVGRQERIIHLCAHFLFRRSQSRFLQRFSRWQHPLQTYWLQYASTTSSYRSRTFLRLHGC
jgi:hypothetical protein